MDEIKKILKEQRQLCLQNLSITNLDPIYQDQILNAPEPNSKSSCAGVMQNEHTEGSFANGLAAYRPFNLNFNAKIKITEAGHKHLEKYYGKYGMVYRKPKVDENGFTEMQLWDIIQMFGEAIYLGCNPPFETTIYLSSQTV